MSGVYPCGCRDCFEVAYGEPGDFCNECEEAGCEPGEECSAPGAYGGDDVDDDFEPPCDPAHEIRHCECGAPAFEEGADCFDCARARAARPTPEDVEAGNG